MKRKGRVTVAVVIGTRPEAVKMAPIVLELRRRPRVFAPLVINTAQHREMVPQMLDIFGIEEDHDLDVMGKNQSLVQLTSRLTVRMGRVLGREKPDLILVEGDTTSVFIGALCGYYLKCPVGHVEAGLRTGRKYSPFPEEMNRRLAGCLSDIHFAPSRSARENLLREGVDGRAVYVTGNTVIDALLHVIGAYGRRPVPFSDRIDFSRDRLVLVTAHRRESFGKPIRDICRALARIAREIPRVKILYPVHPNPNVQQAAHGILKDAPNVILCKPLDYVSFSLLMKSSFCILTDSGGVQEEAPALDKPVLVLREVTEREDAERAGTVKIAGTDTNEIVKWTKRLFYDRAFYRAMASARNPYGDGRAAKKIVSIIARRFGVKEI